MTVAVVSVLGLSACGGGEADDVRSDSAAVDPTTPAADAAESDAESATPTATPVATPESVAPTELVEVDGIATITVTTPRSDLGPRPKLAWEPLEGATGYALVLTTSQGDGYWAWSGEATEIWLGGFVEEPPGTAAGPALYEPMVLRVVALDGSSEIVGASAPTDLAP